ncbi:MAG: DUF3298 and DUF4163 domain-containing protein [Desulfovibrio sp.]|nr:DUF3298 and DUF4163 domain-containing protein [Desulfovibrio sp.]
MSASTLSSNAKPGLSSLAASFFPPPIRVLFPPILVPLLVALIFQAAAASAAGVKARDILGMFDKIPSIAPAEAKTGDFGSVTYVNKAGEELRIAITYPQGLGNADVDADVAAYAGDIRLFQRRWADEFMEEADEDRGLSPYELISDFVLVRPSDRYVSVVFRHYSWTGGAHPNFTLETLSYDLESGMRLTVGDVFPDPSSLTSLTDLLNERVVSCGEEERRNKDCPWLFGISDVLGQMGYFVLAPGGLAVLYPPYAAGPYVEGAKTLDIPREQLARWGANTRYWP